MEKLIVELIDYLIGYGYDSGLIIVIIILAIMIVYLILDNNHLRKEKNAIEERLDKAYKNNIEIINDAKDTHNRFLQEYNNAIYQYTAQLESIKTTIGSLLTIVSSKK